MSSVGAVTQESAGVFCVRAWLEARICVGRFPRYLLFPTAQCYSTAIVPGRCHCE